MSKACSSSPNGLPTYWFARTPAGSSACSFRGSGPPGSRSTSAAIGHNVARLKEIAAPAALLAVLKADAYGHGAVRVARTALLHGADYLATACLSEAIALRGHGIGAPILILGYTPPWQAHEIVRYDLTATRL